MEGKEKKETENKVKKIKIWVKMSKEWNERMKNKEINKG